MKYHVYHFLSTFYNLHFLFFYISCEQPWKSCKTVLRILRDCKVFLEMDQNLGFSMPAILVLSTSHAVFYEIYNNKIEASQLSPSFQIVRPINAQRNPAPQLQNHYPLYWKMKSSKQVYFINMRLLTKIFCKNSFYSFIRNLLLGVMIKILFSVRTGPC